MKEGSEIHIDLSKQSLSLFRNGKILKNYRVSTAKNGPGEAFGSECTPRGRHIIRAKIGSNMPINTVFIARRPTGEIFNEKLREDSPQRDWILTRILWLSGQERGVNRLGKVDTMRRYIYIHGSPETDDLGIPSSHGCIKMTNEDVTELFKCVSVGTPVTITERF